MISGYKKAPANAKALNVVAGGGNHLDLADRNFIDKGICNQLDRVKSMDNSNLNNSSLLLFNALGLSSIDLP